MEISNEFTSVNITVLGQIFQITVSLVGLPTTSTVSEINNINVTISS